MRSKIDIVREIRRNWDAIAARAGTRDRGGVLPASVNLLGSGTKTNKGEKRRYLTAVVYMSPANSAFDRGSERTLCPWATAGCSATCLGEHAGRMPMTGCSNARLWKTTLYLGARRLFGDLLDAEIRAFERRARALGFAPAVRIDGSTDTGAGSNAARRHPEVAFYDYTKSVKRAMHHAAGRYAPNYHVTFSYSGSNWDEAATVLAAGGNVAAVFDTPIKGALPDSWWGFPVYDADDTDLRFLDTARGAIGGLRFKQASGRVAAIERAGTFVIRVTTALRLVA